MASRRNLKRDINLVTHELITECYAYKHYNPSSSDTVNKKIAEILKKRNELIHKVNHPNSEGDHKIVKNHFHNIVKDLEGVIKILDNLDKDK